ncbi:MAG: glucosaminidase domain-containing protein [Candidatus Gastranaerophilales bacterium]|nr:glucosaminidase domain-containing protein [Candidatus Gastranaerophilales bacterium]
MNFNDYLMKRLSVGMQQPAKTGEAGANAGQLDENALKNSSLFSSFSADDLANIDFEKLLSEGVGSDNEALNAVLRSFLELEGIQNAADGDENGELSAEEAKAFIMSVIGKDGDASNLSMEDLDAVVQELGIDLDTVAQALDEVLNENKEEEVKPEEAKEAEKAQAVEEAEEAKEAEKAQAPKAAQQAGGSGGAGASSGVGNSGGASGASNNRKTEEAKGETPEEIKKDIQAKNEEKDKIEADADKEIEEQENAKEKAMKQYGVSDEELEKYKEEEKKLDDQIKDNENSIKDQDKTISDANATIKSNESYIKDIDAQISSNQEVISKISGEDSGDKKAEIESKISNLENEKKAKEEENNKLQNETIKKAEEEKKNLETKNQELEKQKEELLSKTLAESKGFCSGMPSDARKGITEQIKQYDEKVKDIREKRDKDVAEVQKDITALEAKLKTAEEKEKRGEFLKENSAVASSLPENLMKGVLEGKEDVVCEIAEKYGLEPEFFAAIIGLESGWGTSGYATSNFNFGGVSGSGDAGYSVRSSDGHKFAKYSSVEAGLDAMAKNLASYDERFGDVNAVDINNVYAIGGHYCVGGDWANKVSSIYNQIKAKMG